MARRRWIASERTTNPITVMTTELDGLADAAAASGTNSIPNSASTELDMFMDVMFTGQFDGVGAPTADTFIELFIIRSFDSGSVFESFNADGRPRLGYVGAFALDNVAGLQRVVIPGIPIPPEDFRLGVVNRTGASLPLSESTIRAFLYSEQVV